MQKDIFGICLSQSMLAKNLSSTFTHVRAYEQSPQNDHVQVLHTYSQLSGRELLSTIKKSKRLLWRAEYVCLDPDKS
ncbi:hypothetical protein ACODM8_01245 [Vibrio ostreicida]|uniref:Cation transporter n=1 Tax=Vibrio ostreicida TaxID=526588 RepID=A0ABT8BUS4_9VIBR|nr:hypothetical protein [Vibrio ostreicida]MDN3609890.1 hypothetical protein [Vibrio ostreicida]NPD10010.1 hypothetical protein [Vibrio ostreicida]